MLEGLALQRASGALEIEGSPGGTVYLDEGDITMAQASWVPGLATRLRGVIQPAGEAAELLADVDRPGSDAGAVAVRQGLISRDGLAETLRSATVDALIALTVPPEGTASVQRTTFWAGRKHWAGAFCRFSVASVQAEATARAGRLTAGVSPGLRVALRDAGTSCVVLGRDQWEVISRIGGPVSAWDLAWRHGLALYGTADVIGGLVGAGLCVPCPPADLPETYPAAGAATAAQARKRPAGEKAVRAGDDPATALGSRARHPAAPSGRAPSATPPEPERRRGGSGQRPPALPSRRPAAGARQPRPGGGDGVPAAPERPAAAGLMPPPEVLHRVLQGLRNLT